MFRVAYSEIGQLAKFHLLSWTCSTTGWITVCLEQWSLTEMLKCTQWQMMTSELGLWEVVGAVEEWRGHDSSRRAGDMQLQVAFQICIFVCQLNKKKKKSLQAKQTICCKQFNICASHFLFKGSKGMPLLIVVSKKLKKNFLAVYDIRNQLTFLF